MQDSDDDEPTPRRERRTDSHLVGMLTPDSAFEVELNRRIASLEGDMNSLLASRRFWRWIAGLGIPALLGAAFVVLLWMADRVTTSSELSGETKAEIKALGKLIDLLEGEVIELRRHAGIDGKPVVDGRVGANP